MLDPRTFNDDYFIALLEVLSLNFTCARSEIQIRIYLTDAAVIRWRQFSVMLSTNSGHIISILIPNHFSYSVPHNSLVGPVLMPLSKKTINKQSNISLSNSPLKRPKLGYFGWLYPERTNDLINLKEFSKKQNLDLRIVPKSNSLSNEEYLGMLRDTPIVFVSISQSNTLMRSDFLFIYDWWHHHIVWKISEVLTAGSLLIVDDIPDLAELFIEGEDYFALPTFSQTHLNKLLPKLVDQELVKRVSESGHIKYRNYIKSDSFTQGMLHILQ